MLKFNNNQIVKFNNNQIVICFLIYKYIKTKVIFPPAGITSLTS